MASGRGEKRNNHSIRSAFAFFCEESELLSGKRAQVSDRVADAPIPSSPARETRTPKLRIRVPIDNEFRSGGFWHYVCSHNIHSLAQGRSRFLMSKNSLPHAHTLRRMQLEGIFTECRKTFGDHVVDSFFFHF
jgi:hypothetical protein